jgi:hypothetical protein
MWLIKDYITLNVILSKLVWNFFLYILRRRMLCEFTKTKRNVIYIQYFHLFFFDFIAALSFFAQVRDPHKHFFILQRINSTT